MADKKSASEVASTLATKKAVKQTDKVKAVQPKQRSNTSLTKSASMLLERKMTTVVTLSTGLEFEIRRIQSSDTFSSLSSVLIKRLTEQGIELPKDDTVGDFVQEQIANIPQNELVDMMLADDTADKKRMVICQSVVDIDFADLPDDQCPEGVISVHRLYDGELNELYNEIMNFSIPERDVNTFRETDSSDETESES